MAADEVTADEFDEFTPFPKLPMELQLKIWKLAIPGPRVVSDNLLAVRIPLTDAHS